MNHHSRRQKGRANKGLKQAHLDGWDGDALMMDGMEIL
jgi:hypothetical protein